MQLDPRKNRILYLGLEVPEDYLSPHVTVIHCPLIKILPRSSQETMQAINRLAAYSHVIFTSKSAVAIFMDHVMRLRIPREVIESKVFVAVGKMTAAKMREYALVASIIADEETAEGVVKVLANAFDPDLAPMNFSKVNVFWPHSSRSRPVISDWLKLHGINHCSIPLYDTVFQIPEHLPDLDMFDEIVFTSPSTVDAFLLAFERIPNDKILNCIGPVTKSYLEKKGKPL